MHHCREILPSFWWHWGNSAYVTTVQRAFQRHGASRTRIWDLQIHGPIPSGRNTTLSLPLYWMCTYTCLNMPIGHGNLSRRVRMAAGELLGRREPAVCRSRGRRDALPPALQRPGPATAGSPEAAFNVHTMERQVGDPGQRVHCTGRVTFQSNPQANPAFITSDPVLEHVALKSGSACQCNVLMYS